MSSPMRVIDYGSAVSAYSPAKLNVQLAILGQRPDGFHEIETVMLKISLYDRLHVANRPDGRLSLKIRRGNSSISPAIPTGEGNLVLQAASELQRSAGVRFGADIVLDKQIPAEAGLAGGSGNAAAGLMALNLLWRLGLGRAELLPIAGRLGSDVSFFLDPASAAVARGRGERIEPIPIRGPLHFVVIKPPFGLSTASVYQAYREHQPPRRPMAAPVVQALAGGRLDLLGRHLGNDLTPAAEFLKPELADVRKRLATTCPRGALMTGSGSALFGLCGSAREASRVARQTRAACRMHTIAVASI